MKTKFGEAIAWILRFYCMFLLLKKFPSCSDGNKKKGKC